MYFCKVNLKPYAIASTVLNAALMLSIVMMARFCRSNCPEGVTVKTHTVQTKPTEPVLKTFVSYPQPKEITAAASPRKKGPHMDGAGVSGTVAGAPAVFLCEEDSDPFSHICDTVFVYNDTTLIPDTAMIVVEEQIQCSRINRRRVTYHHLLPHTVTYIDRTTPARERIRFYGGLQGGIRRPYADGARTAWAFGPALLLTEPHGMAVGYGFDAVQNGHQVQLLYKIKLKR